MSTSPQLEMDLKELTEMAIKKGASKAKPIKAEHIIIDQRVLLKCKYPPCLYYGQCLMCPPFTPSPEEFAQYLNKFSYGIMVQVMFPYSENLKLKLEEQDQKLSNLFREINDEPTDPCNIAWKKLHEVVSLVEKNAFNRGYYFATGLVASPCKLCKKCDTKSPCKHPYEARPSLDSVGINVCVTAKNAGLDIMFKPRDVITLVGLILVD